MFLGLEIPGRQKMKVLGSMTARTDIFLRVRELGYDQEGMRN
jgi:hypothetical protein